jgi:hypothetical protein
MALVVVENVLNENVRDLGANNTVIDSVNSVIKNKHVLHVELFNSHVAGSESSGTAGNELRNLTHLFRATKVTNQNLIFFEHADGGVGERNGHYHGETFRDGNHDNNNGKSEVLHKFLHEDSSTNFLVDTSLDALNHNSSDENDNCAPDSNVGKCFTEIVQLLLKICLAFSVNLCLHFVTGRVKADASDQSGARTFN